MNHSKISWNASDDYDMMDMFLSLPNPKQKLYSRLSKLLWKIVDTLGESCVFLEPRVFHINERIIELPFVLQRLPKSGRILDVGSSNSALSLQLACMGYQVTGIDVQAYPFIHPNLKFYQEDIAHCAIEKESQDCAILISTIEHVGLGHYGDSRGLSDQAFLEMVARFVKTDGSIFITVPFGKYFQSNWYRVYDSERLNQLIENYNLVTKLFARRISLLEWQLCLEHELTYVSSTDLPMNGIALIEIKKI